MQDNQEKEKNIPQDFEEDFKDFDEDESIKPEIDEDIALQDNKEPLQEEIKENLEEEKDLVQEEQKEEKEEIQKESQNPQEQELSPWEELDENNSVVKKYIFYVSKDFVPYIDNLSTDERSAYINDAIQKKIDIENTSKQKQLKRKLTTHFILMVFSMCLFAPLTLFIAHKAIMATFDNYKYSQENFEKLYKSHFEKDRAYMRSIQYNKEQELKKKKQ